MSTVAMPLVIMMAVVIQLAQPAFAIVTGLTLPPGFAATLYYKGNVHGARSLALSRGPAIAGGGPIVYVADKDAGKVYALLDDNNDGFAERLVTLATGLTESNGVAWHDGSLYISELDRLWRFPGVDTVAHADTGLYPSSRAELLTSALPNATAHGPKYIAISPSGQLYMNIGAPCNVCEPEEYQKNATTPAFMYGTIVKFNLTDWESPEVVASGVRNSVGFDWHPRTGQFWFTDNGRDDIGGSNKTLTEIAPDDELNMVREEGLHYGFPFCHTGARDGDASQPCARHAGVGSPIPDPDLNPGQNAFSCNAAEGTYESAVQALGPHMASLGMRFYRQSPAGYRVVTVTLLANGTSAGVTPFMSGLLEGDVGQAACPGPSGAAVLGRPVDVLQLPDGSLLVSDDSSGQVYKILYAGRTGLTGFAG